MAAFDVQSLGDGALIVRLPGAEVDSIMRMRARITAARVPGVTETVMGYESLAVFADPAAVDTVAGCVNALLASSVRGELDPPQVVEIPVCYDGDFALDLEDIARRSGLDPGEVVRLHAGGEYTVRCVGFTPGFPYLSGLPATLATPRRATPRTQVPAGSVAIGGAQTGIYPTVSPGGWNVIGRTPMQLFDPRRDPPALLRTGDQVRFRSIARSEFEAI